LSVGVVETSSLTKQQRARRKQGKQRKNKISHPLSHLPTHIHTHTYTYTSTYTQQQSPRKMTLTDPLEEDYVDEEEGFSPRALATIR
jgi:hypothetical protein